MGRSTLYYPTWFLGSRLGIFLHVWRLRPQMLFVFLNIKGRDANKQQRRD